MGSYLYILAAFAIGMSVSLQPPVNSYMARTLGSPLLAAVISITITLVFVVPFWLSWGKGGGDLSQLKHLPWWVVLGGIVGMLFVVGGVVVAPVTGMALFFVCAVAGQLLGSAIIDQVGAFGAPVKPVNMVKMLGLFLVFAGALLVQTSNT